MLQGEEEHEGQLYNTFIIILFFCILLYFEVYFIT